MCFHLSRCAVDLKVNIAMASVTPVKTSKKKKSVFLLNLEKGKKKSLYTVKNVFVNLKFWENVFPCLEISDLEFICGLWVWI